MKILGGGGGGCVLSGTLINSHQLQDVETMLV